MNSEGTEVLAAEAEVGDPESGPPALLHAGQHAGGGRPALGLDGHGGQQRRMGQRRRARDLGETGPARPRCWRPCGAAAPPLRVEHRERVDRRLLGCRLEHQSVWALPELVEAAARAGDIELAGDALDRLAETTQPCGTDDALGIEARCRALLSDGAAGEELYRESIDRLSRTQLRPELARAHLLYGEWLRREGRRVDARKQLRTAYDLCGAIGMEAFGERARRELSATGERVRKRSVDTRDQLTPQEDQIARLARDGLSNPEIGAQLFISARTVEWHLGKVFTKLRISSRRLLRPAVPEDSQLLAGA